MIQIGRIIATEKRPTTVDEFYFWTNKELIIKPFDVVKVEHIKNTVTFGVVEEISHITDSASSLSGFISSDFGTDLSFTGNTERIGMNYVKARVVGNTDNIYTPVIDGKMVSLAGEEDVKKALGLDDVRNPLPCGYLEMYETPHKINIPVHVNSHFLIGPEGAHLNISGISGLASKTSYAMFLMKAIQNEYLNNPHKHKDSVAFIIMNVKGRDLLAIDEPNEDKEELEKEVFPIYEKLNIDKTPFKNVKYFYPYSENVTETTYSSSNDYKSQKERGIAFQYKYIFEDDKENLDLLFANVDDPTQTMESIVNYITTEQGSFNGIENWEELTKAIYARTKKGDNGQDKEITIASWRKFYRLFKKTMDKSCIFANI